MGWLEPRALTIRVRGLFFVDADPPGSIHRSLVGRLLAMLTLASGLSGWADLVPPAPVATNVMATALTATFALLLSPVLWWLPWGGGCARLAW